MTSYIVFEKSSGAPEGQSGGGHWVQRGTIEAHSAKAAITAHVKKSGDDGGTFAAVPERSFLTVTAKVETKKAVTLG